MANEKRLIDANAVLRRMNKRREDFVDGWKTLDAMPNGAKCKYEENLECALMIEDTPTVDAVEVVRCKDCHNFTKSKWCNLLMMDVKDDGFCSYGKRRTDDRS